MGTHSCSHAPTLLREIPVDSCWQHQTSSETERASSLTQTPTPGWAASKQNVLFCPDHHPICSFLGCSWLPARQFRLASAYICRHNTRLKNTILSFRSLRWNSWVLSPLSLSYKSGATHWKTTKTTAASRIEKLKPNNFIGELLAYVLNFLSG